MQQQVQPETKNILSVQQERPSKKSPNTGNKRSKADAEAEIYLAEADIDNTGGVEVSDGVGHQSASSYFIDAHRSSAAPKVNVAAESSAGFSVGGSAALVGSIGLGGAIFASSAATSTPDLPSVASVSIAPVLNTQISTTSIILHGLVNSAAVIQGSSPAGSLMELGLYDNSGTLVSMAKLTASNSGSWNWNGFADPLTVADAVLWSKSDGWGNGGVFKSVWSANQINFAAGQMAITLSADGAQSGEYRSHAAYGFGRYETTLQASGTAGTITGFFTYTGPSEGTQHHEIDIEIKGDDPTKLQVNYWTNGVEHPVTINLGFDASQGMHTYAFDWQPNKIDWYVDNVLIHSEVGSNGALPTLPGKLMLNLWATQNAGGWSSDYLPAANPTTVNVESISYSLPAMANDIYTVSTIATDAAGNRGNNQLFGGAGNDNIFGSGGLDQLDGGIGADILNGGAGADTFVLRTGDGGSTIALADVIADFTDGSDILGLAGGLNYTDLVINQGNNVDTASSNAVIKTNAGEYLAVLINTNVNLLGVPDFAILMP